MIDRLTEKNSKYFTGLYSPEVSELLELISQSGKDVISDSFNLIVSKKEELIELFGGKGYNILLLRELSARLGFKVPHVEFITTGFYKKLFNIKEETNKGSILDSFDSLLDEIKEKSNDEKKLIVEEFLKENIEIVKTLLKSITLEKLRSKYSILLDLYCDVYKYDFESIELNEDSIKFYEIVNGKKCESSMISGDSFIDEFNSAILLGLGFIKTKTYEEFIGETEYGRLSHKGDPENEPIDEYYEDMVYGYSFREDLKRQAEVFLGNIDSVILSEEDEKYLRKIFSSFSNSKYLAIRSSANIEDGGKNNYPGIFHTGFCKADDFKTFKSEVINVLESSKGQKVRDYQKQMGLSEEVFMGVVVMEVLGNEYSDIGFEEPITDFNTGPVYLPRRKEEGINEVLYYPDGGGVISTENLVDDTFIRTWGVKGMPTLVTDKGNQSIMADIDKLTGNILGYENQPGNASYYKQTGIAGINKKGEIRYHLEVLYQGENLPKRKIKTNMCYNQLNEATEYSGCNFLPFSLEQYRKLADIYTKLEKKYGSKLELEFVIHNGEVYILQSREVLSNFKKLDNMKKPDESLIEEVFLGEKDITSSMGYINNEELDVSYLYASSGGDLYNEINILEKKSNGYFLILDGFTEILSINKSKFPNLKCIVVKGFKGLGTHVLMILREAGIPVISLNKESKLSVVSGKYKVYINGSNGAMIYR